MPATQKISEQSHAVFGIDGKHAELAAPDDIAYAINLAREVFVRNDADPLACAAAIEKLESDQLLSREEARLCVIWDEAEEVAFKTVTIGWLSRDVDIRLKVSPS